MADTGMRHDGLGRGLLGLGALGLGLGLGLAACFIEPAQPVTFRFQCEVDDDCEVGDECANGLCQRPCGGDSDEACGSEEPICLNGYCSSVCPLAEDPCPEPQTCVGLDPPEAEDPSESGVCTVACETDDDCPEGSLCFADLAGLCVSTCVDTSDCGSAEACVGGVCIPSTGGGGGGGLP